MGCSTYSGVDRLHRAKTVGYATKSINEIFTQQRERKAHKDMLPTGVAFREARDSELHPNSTPVQLWLDVTGSMGIIPQMLIKDGLPKIISTLIQRGVPDVALMFGAIGDHECDNYPLQVAQFESGDAELDMWLTRTYLEGGGGGNQGESYALAWYYAANHIETDAWDKRKQKGFVFTIGDEPCLKTYPKSALAALMGDALNMEKQSYKAEELCKAACERNHVFHIHIDRRNGKEGWEDLLGQHLLVVKSHEEIPALIAETIIKYVNINEDYTTSVGSNTEESQLFL